MQAARSTLAATLALQDWPTHSLGTLAPAAPPAPPAPRFATPRGRRPEAEPAQTSSRLGGPRCESAARALDTLDLLSESLVNVAEGDETDRRQFANPGPQPLGGSHADLVYPGRPDRGRLMMNEDARGATFCYASV